MDEGTKPLNVVGFAVAGGRSSRMGRDKATLPWGDGDLLDHALERLRAVTPDVRILSGPARAYEDRHVPVVVDTASGIGTIAALAAALAAVPEGGTTLLLAVDLPMVTVPLLRHLAAACRGFDAAVPLSMRGAEPLCAAYGSGCRAAVDRAIADGNYRLTGFWNLARVREVGISELAPRGDADRLFFNVNAPGDYETARTMGFRK
jgi:molybdenum cofactor guanylyltransferase